MSDNSKIEWTDATWNPVRAAYPADRAAGDRIGLGWHCEHVSEGCRNCYAEGFNRRLGTGLAYKPGHRKDIDIFLDEKMLLAPLRWKKPRRIFVCSMTDLFADFVTDEMIDRIFAVMALCPHHVFQVLTKRPARMRDYMADHASQNDERNLGTRWCRQVCALGYKERALHGAPRFPLPNVLLGVSVEDQARADERIPHLLATPAAVRFLSCEPLLGPVDLRKLRHPVVGGAHIDALTGFEWSPGEISVPMTHQNWSPDSGNYRVCWVIAGGESGPGARPMHPDWARSLRDQCAPAGVPFFFKQWGEWFPFADMAVGAALASRMRKGRFPDGTEVCSVGKSRAGRLLDGVEYNGVPA